MSGMPPASTSATRSRPEDGALPASRNAPPLTLSSTVEASVSGLVTSGLWRWRRAIRTSSRSASTPPRLVRDVDGMGADVLPRQGAQHVIGQREQPLPPAGVGRRGSSPRSSCPEPPSSRSWSPTEHGQRPPTRAVFSSRTPDLGTSRFARDPHGGSRLERRKENDRPDHFQEDHPNRERIVAST